MCYNRFQCCVEYDFAIYETPPKVTKFKRRAAIDGTTGFWYDVDEAISATNARGTRCPTTKLRERNKIYAFDFTEVFAAITSANATWWDEFLGDGLDGTGANEELWASGMPTPTETQWEFQNGTTLMDVNSTHGFTVAVDSDGAFINKATLIKCPHKDAGDPTESWVIDNSGFGLESWFTVSDSYAYRDNLSAGPRLVRQALGGTAASFFSTGIAPYPKYHDATDRLWFIDYDSGTATWSIKYIGTPDSATWSAGTATTWRSWSDGTAMGASSPLDGIDQNDVYAVRYSDQTAEVFWAMKITRSSIEYDVFAKAPFTDSSDVELVGEVTGSEREWDLGAGLRWAR